DMETLVTLPIELKLTGIADVKQIISTSAEGFSGIEIEFEPDTDIDDAMQKVRDKVDQAKGDLPPDADDPFIREINLSGMPIMYLSLTSDMSLAVLTQFAEDLEDELESIKGVLEVEVVGGIEREIQIIVDPDRAAEYGVSMVDLVQLARVENVNTPAGNLELGDAKYLVRVPGEFSSAEEIEILVVKAGPQGVVYVRDIAVVTDGFKEPETISRIDGTPAVTLTVSKRSGENVIAVADQVRAVARVFEQRLLPGMRLHFTMDESQTIREMVADLENSILSGLILVLGVIFVFMGFRNAVFVSLAIPLSMYICFILFYATGTTLNMVVLFSLILVLGMLVDNGIVIVENIYRHRQLGYDAPTAARMGAEEVQWPIIGSTLTTVAAFLPMFFWPGIWGKFMVYLPMTVVYGLMASLFVGLVVNPALASHFMPQPRIIKEQKPRLVLRLYASLLRLALRWRLVTVTLFATILAVISAVFLSAAQIEFTPTTEPRNAYVDIDGPEGARLETTDRIVHQVEEKVGQFNENTEYIIANVGTRGVSRFSQGAGGRSNIGRVTLDFPNLLEAQVLPSRVVSDLRHLFEDISGAEITLQREQMGPDSGPPLNVEVSGENFATLAELAQKIAGVMATVPDVVDVRDDYDKGRPEVRVRVDREQALLTGLNTQFIGETVKAAVNGTKAGEYREGDEEYDVTVRFPHAFREDLNKLKSMSLVSLNGNAVPFSAVARLEDGAGLGDITRVDRKRTVTVSAEVQNRPATEVLRDVREALRDFPLPPGYSIAYTGENEDMEETEAFLLKAFVVALFLIAGVIVSQFNSIIHALIIMSSVILSLAGVFLGLYLHGMPFGILMTGIGCISLAGVVVNNAIVLLDFINVSRKAGLETVEAIVQAGITRFRPVMLTAITTILGLVPMALGISFDFRNMEWIVGGESSQWWGSMAIAVIYGLGFATMLTLLVVPVLYSMTISVTEAFRGAALAERGASECAGPK
ncbi:MAG: efflux RND transporter permease subunit, partial [Candidatus Hydrogenedentes bacterium]|nr:efflux RND transporter permease subunit [Candidatus Hydrogenedentota bacterium]